jgi:HAD superfamily hydrolase (TIGR01509 family)
VSAAGHAGAEQRTVGDAVHIEDLDLPQRPLGAYLFDLDGTIADSMPLHFRSWTQAVEEAGGRFPEADFYALGGVTLPKTVEILNERYGFTMPPAETARRKELLYLAMLPDVTPVASVLAVIERDRGRIPFAVVSGSPRESIVNTLRRLGLLEDFRVIVGAEDYAHGKPDPEPFLTAADKLQVAPKDCLVFEDADAGIASAEAAGMLWVRIPHASRRRASSSGS